MAVAGFTSLNPVSFVALGAAALGLAALAASIATAGRLGQSPGRRALIHWVPIAVAVIAARVLGGWEVALGVIFGTSVAIMSAVLGCVCFAAPVGPAPVIWKRIWPFTLAAALIVYVSGFNGLLNWKHGLALFVEGLVVLSLWQDSSGYAWADPPRPPGDSLAPPEIEWGSLFVALCLALTGAYLATRGAGLGRVLSRGTIGASLLSLVLATPMIQGDRRLASAGASWVAATAEIGVVLLNLCVLLPLMALAPYAIAIVRAIHVTGRPLLDAATFQPNVTPFPLAHWRIDTVMLILLSVLMLPVSMGKWNLGKEEGVVLIVGYCIYLIAITLAGVPGA